MECICSFLSTFAQNLAAALATGDGQVQPSDLGRYGNQLGSDPSGSAAGLFSNGQAAAFMILLLAAIAVMATERGASFRALSSRIGGSKGHNFSSGDPDDRDNQNNGGGGGELF